MLTVTGIYENGKIELLEEVKISNRRKVYITFVEESQDDDIREITLTPNTLEMKEYLNNQQEDIYQDYLTKQHT